MLVVNELAQWAVLVFVSIMCFGLTRQLSHFIISRRDQLLYEGPDIGKSISEDLLGRERSHEIARAIAATPSRRGILIAMSDTCNGCAYIVEELEDVGPPDGVLTIALANSSDESFIARLSEHFDHVVQDPNAERAKAAGMYATPFLLGLDEDLHVAHRGISSGPRAFTREWNEREGINEATAGTPDHSLVSHT